MRAQRQWIRRVPWAVASGLRLAGQIRHALASFSVLHVTSVMAMAGWRTEPRVISNHLREGRRCRPMSGAAATEQALDCFMAVL